MISSGIYAIINRISGKAYIGSTIRFKRRWNEHRDALQHNGHGNLYLQNAWNKYGENKFKFMVCEYVEDHEQLVVREQYWLDFHRMYVDMYNTILAVDRTSGMLGKTHSKETKCKISESLIGNQCALGCKHSKEARRKRSERFMGNQYALGCIYSKETKQKMSVARMGALNPNYGKKASKETRQKMSKARKEWWARAKAQNI